MCVISAVSNLGLEGRILVRIVSVLSHCLSHTIHNFIQTIKQFYAWLTVICLFVNSVVSYLGFKGRISIRIESGLDYYLAHTFHFIQSIKQRKYHCQLKRTHCFVVSCEVFVTLR